MKHILVHASEYLQNNGYGYIPRAVLIKIMQEGLNVAAQQLSDQLPYSQLYWSEAHIGISESYELLQRIINEVPEKYV